MRTRSGRSGLLADRHAVPERTHQQPRAVVCACVCICHAVLLLEGAVDMHPVAAGSAAAADFQCIERAGMPVLYAVCLTVFANEGLQLWLAEVVLPISAGGCSRGEVSSCCLRAGHADIGHELTADYDHVNIGHERPLRAGHADIGHELTADYDHVNIGHERPLRPCGCWA
jgi:hypothetical protein